MSNNSSKTFMKFLPMIIATILVLVIIGYLVSGTTSAPPSSITVKGIAPTDNIHLSSINSPNTPVGNTTDLQMGVSAANLNNTETFRSNIEFYSPATATQQSYNNSLVLEFRLTGFENWPSHDSALLLKHIMYNEESSINPMDPTGFIGYSGSIHWIHLVDPSK